MENKRFVTLYLGCADDRNTVDLEMESTKIDYWSEDNLNKTGVKTDLITGFRVGSKMVLEIYSDPFFYRLRKVLKNPRTDVDVKWDLGCKIDHGVWNGIIRSFKVWDYDHYMDIHGIRYCNRDEQCRNNELCLCKGGEKKAEWCPISKQRCMPKGQFLHDAEKKVYDGTLINMNCLKDEINRNIKKWGNDYEIFGEIRNMSKRCSGPDMIEPGLNSQNLSLSYYYTSDNTPSLRARHNLISNNLVKALEGFGPARSNVDFFQNLIVVLSLALIFCVVLYVYRNN